MKIRTILALLLLWYAPFGAAAEVSIKTTNNSITASTNEYGTRGYQGCEAAAHNEVPGYVFILLVSEKAIDDGGDDPCKDDGPFKGDTRGMNSGWEEINRIASAEPQATFAELPKGRYRVEVLVGQAIGCLVEGAGEAMPERSIVYLQEKTTPVILGSKIRNRDLLELTGETIPLNNLMVFPNPTSNELQIQLHNPELGANTRIVLYDLLGRALIEKKESTPSSEQAFFWTIDVGQFSDGAYLLVVEDENGHSYQEKIIVQRD